MSLVNCLSIHRELLKDFDTSEIEAGAAAYAKKGMGAQAAERKAIADKLADLSGERERVTKLALDTHNEKTVKGYEPFDTGSGWVLRKEVKPQSEAQRAAQSNRAKDAETVYPDKDSLFTAIAKLGGLDKAEAVSTWGADPADFRPSKVFRKPTLRNGGRSIDDIAEKLGELGYLERDANGKIDTAQFEELFRDGENVFAAQGYERQAEMRQKSYEESLAQKFVDENPDQTMKDDNGNTVLAKDYYEQYQRQIKEAENDANAFAAAINCALGEG